ncbi:MAG TPA: prepilin peptidase, partial [Solirubrobacteraceae bacterium]|nr:prepilin peptidase [Solirubrobacteraceae bacterium]
VAGVLGLIFGSFLNVVAYRLPRGESLARPASRCPGCDAPIRPYDNLPVVSWVLLRGRCRSCGERIAWRYPLVELATALLMALTVVVIGPNEEAWLGLAFVLLLVPVTLIDIDFRIIPNKLMLIGTLAAPAILALTDPGALPEHLIAAVAAGGFLLVAAIAYPGGMGMGDVKLAFVMGLFLGRDVGVALMAGLLAGSVVGAVIIARKGAREGRKTAVPFGPFLALGSLVALFAGELIVDWYLTTFM